MNSDIEIPCPEEWPFFVRPQNDELLSSWLFRLAASHRYKPHTFCHLNWPGMQIWNRDIDRLAKAELLQTLAKKTNTPFKIVANTLLSSFEGKLFSKHNAFGNTNWIMPLGIIHRKRNNYGLQVCPNCLTKKIPYYKKLWRLSLSVCCVDCKVLLIDRCKNCHSPIIFHRIGITKKTDFFDDDISRCYHCNISLKESSVNQTDDLIFLIQKKLNSNLQLGYHPLTHYSHLYFDVIHHLIALLTSKDKRLRKFQENIHKGSQIPENIYPTKQSIIIFDHQPVQVREFYLKKIIWLLEEWPERFIELCRESNTWYTLLTKDMKTIPFWYYNIVSSRLSFKFAPIIKKKNSY